MKLTCIIEPVIRCVWYRNFVMNQILLSFGHHIEHCSFIMLDEIDSEIHEVIGT